MPYTLRALIARREVLAGAPAWIADSAVIDLPQGFRILPVSRDLCYQFGPADRPWLYPTHSICTHLPDGLLPHVLELSRGGRVAYVEAEFHGGDGEQRWMGWENGAAAHEPEEGYGAINAGLRWLGVERSDNADAFDTLGLGRHRSVDDWLAEARKPAAPPPSPPADPAPSIATPEPAPRPWWRFWG
jgi:hypothetical protein